VARAAAVRGTQLGALLAVRRGHPDAADARGRRALPVDLGPASDHAVLGDAPRTDVAWLGPYPGDGPGELYEQREAVELAFVAALQHLPGNQRAALLLFEVLGFSAAEIADALGTSVASVNSALQRARAIVAAKVPARSQQQSLRQLGDDRVRAIVTGWSAALRNGDADGLVALLTEDVTWSMPPLPHWYSGLAAVTDFAVRLPLTSCGDWRHVPVTANGQPAVASYLRDSGSGPFRRWSVSVLTLREDRIAEITSFVGDEYFNPFGLPAALSGDLS
jgi:RNA polymerase sigma-70 factor (ECF subfamily)